MSGIGEVENRIKVATHRYYNEINASDIYIKSKNAYGFDDQTLQTLRNRFGEENVCANFCYELVTRENGDDSTITQITRVYCTDFADNNINALTLLNGRLPETADEIVVERATSKLKSYGIGDKTNIGGTEYTVCGIVLSPLYINKVEEPSFTDADVALDYTVYFDSALSSNYLVNDVYITIEDRDLFRAFSKPYKSEIDKLKTELTAQLGEENASVLSLYENTGFYALISYAEKVGLISVIFVIFFLLVTMLVVYSNMSRLLDEDRNQIACLKTLGYGDFAIVSRYLLFVLIGTVIGGALALPVGLAVTSIIYSSFDIQYVMPSFSAAVYPVYYIITFAVIIVGMLLLTFVTSMQIVRNKPVTLLTHKAPKSGKKVFLEHIEFIWRRLSFKYKSTLRNVLLFKSRFFMTVISIIGSTVLVLSGLGLLDCAVSLGNAISIIAIAVALIIFSALLCALVIYNITNINVSERNREIATLMVLGYHDKEVTGYVFREIYIMCLIGAISGVPLGIGFLQFVFDLIDFGALADINWWTWIFAPALTMLFAFLSTLLLRRRITKTDMNASLKILE